MKKLFTIFLVLLFCASAYGTKVGRQNISTAVASVQTTVDILEILTSDELALMGVGTGNVFYVDSGVGGGTGSGLDWTNAELTIEAAIGNCTANAGDFIVCAPYHAETASTGTFDLAKDGITLIGLGKGDAMTTITYDSTTDTVIMGSAGDGCTIRNIKFIASVTDVVSAIVVEAGCTDFIIEDCIFENETSGTDEFIDTIYVTTGGSNRGVIRRNRFLGDAGANAGPNASINFIDADFLQIYDNEFSGDISDAHIFNETTASNFVTIRDNRILCGFIGDGVTTLDTTPGISLVATTTGWIQDNFIVTNVATPDLAIVAADCYLSGNTYNGTQGAASGAVDIGTVAGQTYASTMSVIDINDTDLFDVDGGAILITSFFGMITTVIETQSCTIELTMNADSNIDYDFCTAVEVTGDLDGDRITFDNTLNESVFTPLTGADNGAATTMVGWFCDEGMIWQDTSAENTGVIKWHMTWIPYENGTIVTPQDGVAN